MYPRNAASPERIAVGAVVQISDGAVQSSGVSISVRGQGGSSGAGSGTTAYDNGIVEYTPTQGETDFTSFVVVAYKTGCIPCSQTIVTTASVTPGYAGIDWAKVANPTTTQDLSGTTIKTTQKVDVETIKTQAITCGAGVTLGVYLGGTAAAAPATALATLAGTIATLDALLLKVRKYFMLALRKDAAIATDASTEKTELNANLGAGAGAYDQTTDSAEATRDRGDAAWITATGFSTLDAAGIRTAVGLGSANLDTQFTTLSSHGDSTWATATGFSTFDPATDTIEGLITWAEGARLWNSAAGGKASGLDTTNAKYRDLGDTKDRIDATVDADGNRSAVTLNLS